MSKPTVLIVEDEAPLVTMLRYNLEKEGFQVCEAGDGEEALVQIAERKPDIVLLDWMLPLVSGIEVCRQLRRSPETRARLRAVIRRAQPGAAEEVLQFADITMDLAAHRVSRNGKAVHLGPTEFRLLRHLLRSPGRVFSREQLLDAVWGHDVYVEPRTVDVHIRRLRKALNAYGDADIVRTVRSAGYAIDRPAH